MAVLHKRQEGSNIHSIEASTAEQKICQVIANHSSDCFDEYLSKSMEWSDFYHLSAMRNSLFNWYEFDEKAELLEVGGGFGALTGFFCDACRHVTTIEPLPYRAEAIAARYKNRNNLDIVIGMVEEISFSQPFDYVIAVGILEVHPDPVRLLIHLKKLLKPSGKILLACENQYGIRYFCGAPDFHTGKPFDSINHYPLETSGRCYNKKKLTDFLKQAGIEKYKIYYPVPDYRLPMEIYTDDYLPQKNIKDRVIAYYPESESLIALEDDLYDDLIDNDVFPFFSNSYLIECGNTKEFCTVIYAALSTDRGKKHGFTTTIHTNHSVKKRALYPEGKENFQILIENLNELSKRDISVITYKLEENNLVMPYITSPTLMHCLEMSIENNHNQFIALIDQLYQLILASSEHVSYDVSQMKDESLRDIITPILKNAYIDMIPLNCFWVDGQIVFFDQEFKKENYPAKYILFRALRYTYLNIPKAEAEIPIKYFQDKYKLTKLWKLFMSEEECFVEHNRNYKIYHQFYQWTVVDKTAIYTKAHQLLKEKSVKSKAVLIDLRKEQHNKVSKIQLDLLKVLDLICKENDLRYCAIYGTLLGAIRHRGFIPWDDDIDVTMPRKDYEQLLLIAKSTFQSPYFLQTPENDPECFYGGYAKLRNSNTTGVEAKNKGHNCNQGIWIDIFPLDVCYSDKKLKTRHLNKIRLYQKLLYVKIYPETFDKVGHDIKYKKLWVFIATHAKHSWLCLQLKKALTSCKEKKSESLAILAHYQKIEECNIFRKIDFTDSIMMRFEDMEIPVPIGYRHCLELRMGNDYMLYPSYQERMPHHEGIFLPDTDYQTYINNVNI